ncbi:putative transcription factor Nin-like family [Helianthus debilis subsp. tardiflorus]
MSREVSCDLVGGSNHSGVLGTLKSRYACAHEPLPAAATATPDDRRYLTSLWVFEDREVDEPESPLPPSFSNLMVDQSIIDPHMIKEKITSVLKVLKFREQHVLVQFWSPVTVQKRWLLTTWDQPFGLGLADEELYSYRKKSERFAVVADEEHREKLGSPGRVYSHKLPEWSLEVQGQDTSNNVHGYINLPVFESSSDSCVGVLEIITSSSYVDFAFEVQEVSGALKNQNLKSPNVFEDPSLSIADERRRRELDDIFKALKTSCSSFNRSCIGKVCISTVALPFYVRDLNLWEFREVCRERHLDKSQGVVGRSLSSCGAWFCEDVTKLDEDDYPLVHIALSSGLNSCLAIYLKSPESDAEHVIEFFLPAHSANETGLRRLMETFKQQIKNSSWMQLDIVSPPQVLGGVPFNWDFESPPSPVNLLTEKGEAPPPESENMENEPSNSAAGGTSQNKIEDFNIDSGKVSRKRKRSDRMISYEEISKHFGKTMDEAAAILNVSRSTLKRICRNLGIPRWPYKTGPYKSDTDTFMKSDQTDVAVFTSEGTHTPTPVFGGSNEPFGGTPYITRDPTFVTENGKHSSTHVPHEKEQADVTFKATYRDDTIKFTYRLLDGLVKLEEEVATRFQLTVGSFRLRYKDEDGDMITIACDNDLKALGAFMQLTSTNMIKLSVQMVAVHSTGA